MVAGLVLLNHERAIAQWSQGRSEREIRQFLIASQTTVAASRINRLRSRPFIVRKGWNGIMFMSPVSPKVFCPHCLDAFF